MFRQYDSVQLKKEMLSDSFVGKPVRMYPGQRGVIVEIYRTPGLPIGYEVEFFNDKQETIGLMTVQASDIEPASIPLQTG